MSGIKIIIHTCNKREWYVKDYLIPSLLLQGFQQQEIKVWQDYAGVGNLRSFVDCMEWVSCNLESGSAAWHLQDDVLVSKNFKKIVDVDYQGVVCGFCYDKCDLMNINKFGRVPAQYMWFSFPCIRIPNSYCGEFVEWFNGLDLMGEGKYAKWFQSGKLDDAFWFDFMMQKHHREYVVNLKPNIVEHVDWLIGGSQVNADRNRVCRTFYWGQEDLVDDLKKKLGVG